MFTNRQFILINGFIIVRSVIKGCVMTVQSVNNYQQSNSYNQNMYNQNSEFNSYPAYYNSESRFLIDVKEHPDCLEYVYEKPASTGKKVGVGIASGFIPGLGQMVNGEWGKGLAFFGTNLLTSILLGTHTAGGVLKDVVLGAVGLGISIFSIVDAVKGAKKQETVVVPKQNQTNYNRFA